MHFSTAVSQLRENKTRISPSELTSTYYSLWYGTSRPLLIASQSPALSFSSSIPSNMVFWLSGTLKLPVPSLLCLAIRLIRNLGALETDAPLQISPTSFCKANISICNEKQTQNSQREREEMGGGVTAGSSPPMIKCASYVILQGSLITKLGRAVPLPLKLSTF